MTAGPFDPTVLDNDPIRRGTLLEILADALAEVDPERAVRRAVRHQGDSVAIADIELDPATIDQIRVLAFGKAAPAMARAPVRDNKPPGVPPRMRPSFVTG